MLPVGSEYTICSATSRSLLYESVMWMGSQFVLVQADAYLFVFQSVGSEVRDGINAAQSVFQLVYVCIQFPIGFLLAFHRDE